MVAAAASASTGDREVDSDSDSQKYHQSGAIARSLAVQEAHSAGQLGVGLGAGGFLFPYHLGALWELQRLGLAVPGRTRCELIPAFVSAVISIKVCEDSQLTDHL